MQFLSVFRARIDRVCKLPAKRDRGKVLRLTDGLRQANRTDGMRGGQVGRRHHSAVRGHFSAFEFASNANALERTNKAARG